MTAKTRRRVSRKDRRCDLVGHGFGPSLILAGDVYLEHTEFPGGDAGYATAAGHPVRMVECARCATTYGRGYELEPVPTEQAYRDGLVGMPS